MKLPFASAFPSKSTLCFFSLLLLGLAPLKATPAALRDISSLASTPAVSPSESIRASDDRIRAIFFEGAPYQGHPTRVFAWLGVPKLAAGEQAPGIVLLHGGGGTAFESWVKLWVDRGYAAIAIDHFGTLPVPLDAKPRPRNPDGGPLGGGAAFTKLGDPVRDQWPFHAVVAASRALSLLREQPGVDPDRIGATGISWGGYLACVFAGVDRRLRFVVPVYGCGHYEDTVFAATLAKRPAPELALWRETWDATNYIPSITAPTLWVNGTNDHFFWLPAWQKSYRQTDPERRTLALHVRMPHDHPPAGDPPEVLAFADSVVRGAPALARITRLEREDRLVTVTYSSPRPIVRAELNYATAAESTWEKREWRTIPANLSPGFAQATLPSDAAIFFLNLFDDRGLLVSSEHQATALSTN